MYSNNYLAALFLKYMLEEGKTSDNDGDGIIASLTDDDFLRALVPIATYWSNDLIDICFDQLDVEQPEDIESFNTNTHDQWYAWFEKTVNEQWEKAKN